MKPAGWTSRSVYGVRKGGQAATVFGLDRCTAGVLSIAIALGAAACGGSPDSPTSPTPAAPLPDMSLMLSEKTLGSPAAPVTMTEYSSLTCSHCGDFHSTTLPALKANYIDTGRLRVVYRDFPLNEAAIAGAMVARCSGEGYFATLEALFKAQATWASASDYRSAIKNVVAGLGMSSNVVDACLASTELRNGVLALKQGGQASGVSGTPTFFINGRTVIGAYPYSYFASIIDSF